MAVPTAHIGVNKEDLACNLVFNKILTQIWKYISNSIGNTNMDIKYAISFTSKMANPLLEHCTA